MENALKLRVIEVRHNSGGASVVLALPSADRVAFSFEKITLPLANNGAGWFQERIGKVLTLRAEDT